MAQLNFLNGRRKWLLVVLVVCIYIVLHLLTTSTRESVHYNGNQQPATHMSTAAIYRDNTMIMLNNQLYYREEPPTTAVATMLSANQTMGAQTKVDVFIDKFVLENMTSTQNNMSTKVPAALQSNSKPLGLSTVNQTDTPANISPSSASISNTPFSRDDRTILILFTTFKDKPDRLYPQSQIILNWAQFRPWIQPVLYSPDKNGTLIDLAKKNGWHIYEEQGANKHHTPLLKPMYTHAMTHYNTTLYGFANGDILFNSGLIDTIKYVHAHHHRFNTTLVTGKRWNFRYYMYNYTDIWPNEKVNELRTKSSQFRSDAEDYFITTRDFPWHQLKDVVIGRPGYDNYVVAMANKLNVSGVDASSTILAVHITLNGSIYAGARNADSRYNKNLIGRFHFNAGATSTTRFSTHRDKSRNIQVTQRWDPVTKAKKDAEKRRQKELEKQKKAQENKKGGEEKKV